MTRYPWMVFQNTGSTGLEKIPLNGNVQIVDAGGGKPKYITVINISGLDGMSIADLLAAPTQWLEISTPERGGLVWELGVSYKTGDTVDEGGKIWISLSDHTSLTGDVPDGSPSQPNQTTWTNDVIVDPGSYA